jgi:hypothetical protein
MTDPKDEESGHQAVNAEAQEPKRLPPTTAMNL